MDGIFFRRLAPDHIIKICGNFFTTKSGTIKSKVVPGQYKYAMESPGAIYFAQKSKKTSEINFNTTPKEVIP